jgi:hypothetical protein
MIVNMFILLYSHSMMMARGVHARGLPAAYSLLSPTPISPIAAPSEEQKEHEDNKNEVHIFLQNNLAGVFPPAHVDAEFYSPASDSTYVRRNLRQAVQPSLRPDSVVVGNDRVTFVALFSRRTRVGRSSDQSAMQSWVVPEV